MISPILIKVGQCQWFYPWVQTLIRTHLEGLYPEIFLSHAYILIYLQAAHTWLSNSWQAQNSTTRKHGLLQYQRQSTASDNIFLTASFYIPKADFVRSHPCLCWSYLPYSKITSLLTFDWDQLLPNEQLSQNE